MFILSHIDNFSEETQGGWEESEVGSEDNFPLQSRVETRSKTWLEKLSLRC